MTSIKKLANKYLMYYPSTLLKGENIAKYRKLYNRTQYLQHSDIETFQREHLRKLLEFSAEYSLFYSGYEVGEKNISIDNFKNIPFLDKKTLIKNVDNIVTYKKRWSERKTTGGSTGEPVGLFKNVDALARERAITWRGYNWAGIEIGDKQARFWGVPHNANAKFLAKVKDVVASRVRVSAFDIKESTLLAYHKLLLREQPDYLYGYVSAIKILAQYINDNNLEKIRSIKSVITTSEVLSEFDRNIIQNGFSVKVFNEYGCGEVGSIAHECEHGNMHLMSENLIVELDSDQSDNTGELVVTDLHNYATPLIRYKLGDYATLSYESCPCGRELPILKEIHGRAYDLISAANGKKVHPEALIYVFEDIQKTMSVIKQFQIIQKELDVFDVLYVSDRNLEAAIEAHIIGEFSKITELAQSINFKRVENIERESSGKMRVVKSHI